MNSQVAEVITLLKAHMTGLGGISPSPVPTTAQFPYITVSEVHDHDIESLTGISGLQVSIIQIDSWDKTLEHAWAMRKQVRDYLLPFHGVAGSITVRWIRTNVNTSLYDGNRSLHQCITRLFIWWE